MHTAALLMRWALLLALAGTGAARPSTRRIRDKIELQNRLQDAARLVMDPEGGRFTPDEAIEPLTSPGGLKLRDLPRRDAEQLRHAPYANDECSCHGHRFLYQAKHHDCFNPWLEQVTTTCDFMCSCYSESARPFLYTAKAKSCRMAPALANGTNGTGSTNGDNGTNDTSDSNGSNGTKSTTSYVRRLIPVTSTSPRSWQVLRMKHAISCTVKDDVKNITTVCDGCAMVKYNATVEQDKGRVFLKRNASGVTDDGWLKAPPLSCLLGVEHPVGSPVDLPVCSSTGNTCADDPYWRDADGDGCSFYADYPRPQLACNTPGYTSALIYCPVACGTCGHQGLSTSLSSTYYIHPRFFDAFTRRRSECLVDNDLGEIGKGKGKKVRGNRLEPTAIIEDHMGESGLRARVRSGAVSANLNLCARQCFRLRDSQGRHMCQSFSIFNNSAGAGNGLNQYCRYSSTCVDERLLTSLNVTVLNVSNTTAEQSEDVLWDTYFIKPATSPSCDRTPGSPIHKDACGVCGGSNQSCRASVTLVTTHETPPSKDLGITESKWLPEELASLRRSGLEPENCTLAPYTPECIIAKKMYVPYARVPPEVKTYSTVHAYLRVKGDKGINEVMLGFGSHKGGEQAVFHMTGPTAVMLGEIE